MAVMKSAHITHRQVRARKSTSIFITLLTQNNDLPITFVNVLSSLLRISELVIIKIKGWRYKEIAEMNVCDIDYLIQRIKANPGLGCNSKE